ncbi:hypothetical protein ACHAWF_008195 [Thalassiosira exigua]
MTMVRAAAVAAVAACLLLRGPAVVPTAAAWSSARAGGGSGPHAGPQAGAGGVVAAEAEVDGRATTSLSLAEGVADVDAAGGECGVAPEVPEAAPSAVSDDPPASLTRKPRPGDVVTFSLLRLEPSDDDVLEPLFDASGTLQLVLDGGNYLPGLHRLLSTMAPGEVVRGASIDAGYGGYDPALAFRISTSDLGGSLDVSAVRIGTKLRMGNGMECRVTAMDEDGWTLDANHPLAGAAYDVDVRLERVEEGPKNMGYVAGENDDRYRVATFALGCFWGGELAYQRTPGVISTQVGYTAGHKENPTYEEVCTGATGHTEAIQVIYDPNAVSYESLVRLGLDRLGEDVYKLNQVGNDRGTQYRHGVYYHDDDQRDAAAKLLEELRRDDRRDVQTELEEVGTFYPAEEYHQQYLLKGGQSARKGARDAIRCYG